MTTVNGEVDSRERILAAALEEIREKGILGLRIADVAAKAGVSQSAIYKFYRDRDGLLAKVLGDLLRSFHTVEAHAIQKFLEESTGPIDPADLMQFFVHPTDPMRRQRRWLRMQSFVAAAEIPALWEEVQKSQTELIELLEMFANEVRRRGGVTGEFDSRAFAHSVAAQLLGLVYNDVVTNKVSDEEFFRHMGDYLRRHLS